MNILKGFTLIELMVVVIIMGILAGIAYPSYTQQVMKTRRADGQGALLHLATSMEHYFTEHQTYLGASQPSDVGHSSSSPQGYYSLSLTDVSETSYTVVATPKGAQANDSCGALSIRHPFKQLPTQCW
jgi:type IV pilus assembly protein PilE